MAHYAKVLDGEVTQVIVAEPEFFNEFVDTEPGEWIRYSYNMRGGVYIDPETNEPAADQSVIEGDEARMRKNAATIGGTYDYDLDAFIAPKPHRNWVLNTDTCEWEPPHPAPQTGHVYWWSDDDYEEDPTLGWVQVTE